MKEIISVEALSKSYDANTHVLRDLNFTIHEGEWTSVMGPSGSGKTTLLNILSCLDRPSGGRVLIDGTDVTELDQNGLARFRREHMGLVFQQYHLIPYLTALENVMLAQYYHSIPDEEEAKEALRAVGLGHRLDHIPAHLSGGEQQRVCIARALINHPQIIFADEPTGNLDQKNSKAILELFGVFHRQGRTIVMVTHDPQVAALGDRLIRLVDGKVVEDSRQVPRKIFGGVMPGLAAT